MSRTGRSTRGVSVSTSAAKRHLGQFQVNGSIRHGESRGPGLPAALHRAAAFAIRNDFHLALIRAERESAGRIGKGNIRLRRGLRQLGTVLAHDQGVDRQILLVAMDGQFESLRQQRLEHFRNLVLRHAFGDLGLNLESLLGHPIRDPEPDTPSHDRRCESSPPKTRSPYRRGRHRPSCRSWPCRTGAAA